MLKARASSKILQVPPAGHCLFSCAVAVRDVRRLRSLSLTQDEHGVPLSRHEDMELQTTCARLRETVGAMAAEDVCFGLVEGLPNSNLPDGLIIEYVARWLQR